MKLWRYSAALLIPAAGFAACSDDGGETDDGPPPPDPVTVCEAQCVALYPAAEATYVAFRSCQLCEACADLCGTIAECEMPVEAGCSAGFANCEACIASPCGGGQLPDTTFTGHCADAGNACTGNVDCVKLNNCVNSCIYDTGSGEGGGAANGGGGGA